ncbi:WhiB family transcriptional regulator [Streptomyces sp. NPDC014006]|uniref:WhiB family transcriptional regulator n=1 Tax=Streptomyces sp. NPDC014006 TaxID=3364870 RepID=UPI0036F8F9DB
MNWLDLAACRFEDPELFFPLTEDGASLPQIERARQICHRCPVIRECRTAAVRHGESDGVWGGLTARQRKALLARPADRRARGSGDTG